MFRGGTYYIFAYLREQGTAVYETRARQKVEVFGDNIAALTVTLSPGVSIQGKLKADGLTSILLDRITLSLTSVDEDGFSGRSEVKKDGSFEFRSVHDGNYALQVWGLEGGAYIKSARHGPDDLLEKGLQVEGAAPGQIEVSASSDGAKLDGSVSDDDGPATGARVRLVPEPLTPYNHIRIQRTTTDQLGHFSLTDIAAGKYTLRAKPMVSSEGSMYKSETQSITLSESDHKTIEMKLEKGQE